MSTETVEAPQETGFSDHYVAHAYCKGQQENFPGLPDSGKAVAWCGAIKTTSFAPARSVSMNDHCVVCAELIREKRPCPHCGVTPWAR